MTVVYADDVYSILLPLVYIFIPAKHIFSLLFKGPTWQLLNQDVEPQCTPKNTMMYPSTALIFAWMHTSGMVLYVQ